MPVLGEPSKYVAKYLHTLDEQYPKPWKGKLFDYRGLKAELARLGPSDDPKKAPVDARPFFHALLAEVERVSNQFQRAAAEVLRVHRAQRSGWARFAPSMVTRFRQRIRLNSSEYADASSPEAVAFHARVCLEYGRSSALALRRILQDHDEQIGNDHGSIVRDSLWRNRSGLASFLHSPLLTELDAVVHTFSSPTRRRGGLWTKAEPQTADKQRTGIFGSGYGRQKRKRRNRQVHPEPAALEVPHEPLDEPDLQCPVCLDTMFKPVALGCGHAFCQGCMLKAVSNSRHGAAALSGLSVALSSVPKGAKCPACRQVGVFGSATPLWELGEYVRERHPEYWATREEEEREEEAKSKEELLRRLEEKRKRTAGQPEMMLVYAE